MQVRFVGAKGSLGKFALCQFINFWCTSFDSCDSQVGERG